MARRRARKAAARLAREDDRNRKAAELEERSAGRRKPRGCARRPRRRARCCCGGPAELRDAAGGSIRDCFAGLPGAARPARPAAFPAVRPDPGGAGDAARQDEARRYHRVDRARGPGEPGRGRCRAAGGTGCGRRRAPKTVTRLLGMTGAQALADAVACYLAAAEPAGPGRLPGGRAGPAAVAGLRRQGDPRRGPRRRDQPVPAVGRDRAGSCSPTGRSPPRRTRSRKSGRCCWT